MHRHCGRITEVLTPMGKVFNQVGKDLSDVSYVIGTGGVVIKSKNQYEILKQTTNILHNPSELRPNDPEFLVDHDYIMAAMGLLSKINPMVALKIMKKHISHIRGRQDETSK
jgi:uncharacterized protein (TIGR01319 family)